MLAAFPRPRCVLCAHGRTSQRAEAENGYDAQVDRCAERDDLQCANCITAYLLCRVHLVLTANGCEHWIGHVKLLDDEMLIDVLRE